MKRLLKKILRRSGWELRRVDSGHPDLNHVLCDLDPAERAIVQSVQPYTMTSPERIAALVSATKHIVHRGIPGAIVECGVWRGGSTMAAVLSLLAEGETTREVYLYDTFQGMSPASDRDVSLHGQPAATLLQRDTPGTGIWCRADLEDVQTNLRTTGYPQHRLHFVQGKVEDTIPGTLPEQIALLRLDTDWYESTRHELAFLFPRLCEGGILIIDDYGHWQGARAAVDEFFSRLPGGAPFLHRIDYTGRLVVKTVH